MYNHTKTTSVISLVAMAISLCSPTCPLKGRTCQRVPAHHVKRVAFAWRVNVQNRMRRKKQVSACVRIFMCKYKYIYIYI